MIVRVTREDINAGVCGSATRCPIALAAKRALDDPRVRVRVKPEIVDSDGNVYRVPDSVRGFMWSFDMLYYVAPFSFRIEKESQ